MFSFIESLMATGFVLLSLGGLAELTYDLAKASARHQFVSLGQWNRVLYGEKVHQARTPHRSAKMPGEGSLNKLIRDLE